MTLPIGKVMRSKNAFTLVELLLVIIVLSVIVVLSAPNLSKTFKRMELKRTASDIAYLVRWGQARAAKDGLDYQLAFTDGYRSYRIYRVKLPQERLNEEFMPVDIQMGRVFKVPESVKVSASSSTIRIHPDGTLDKVRINLEHQGSKVVVSSVEQRGNIFIIEDDHGA